VAEQMLLLQLFAALSRIMSALCQDINLNYVNCLPDVVSQKEGGYVE
jgi:hypothetical protein